MRFNIACLVFTLCVISNSYAQQNLQHYVIYKNFDTFFRECGEYFEVPNCTLDEYVVNAYPDEPEVQKLIHCAMVGFGGWVGGSGVVEYVMSNFFNPAPEDTCYADRTRECIQNAQPLCASNATLAYKAFQCYYRQYGNLNQTAQFIPNSDLELQVLLETSIAAVNVPKDELVNYSNGVLLDQPHFAELMYVVLLRGGYYYPGQGLFLKNLYTQFGNSELLTPETQQCVDAATAAWDGQYQRDLIYAYLVNCLQKITPWLQLVQNVATSLVTVPPPPCPPPSTTTITTTTTTTTTPPPPSTPPQCYNLRN
nr:general odorant-binding protein 69-like [Aedes albopictus]